MAQGTQPNHHVTNKKNSVKIESGSIFGQEKLRSIFEQKNKKTEKRVSFTDWLKANWSKPIMSPEELQKQKALYEKEHPGTYPAFKE